LFICSSCGNSLVLFMQLFPHVLHAPA
jgi:hypothetical protein